MQEYNRMERWIHKLMAFKEMYGEEVQVGFIDVTADELVKESFQHINTDLVPGLGRYSLPNAILIKEGKCYFRSPMQYAAKEVHQFYDREYVNAKMSLGVQSRPN